MTKIIFKLDTDQRILIMKDNVEIGHIFSPAGSGHNHLNAIQVCGFSEAFDLWGCGIYEGFKDIQLLFDGQKMSGEFDTHLSVDSCGVCYHIPCACDVHKDESSGAKLLVKRSHDMSFENRLECKEKNQAQDDLIKELEEGKYK